MSGSAPDGEPILNPQVMCLYICNNNTEGQGGGGGYPGACGKSDIADSSPALAFKFQRNKMFPLCSIVNIKYCGQVQYYDLFGRFDTHFLSGAYLENYCADYSHIAHTFMISKALPFHVFEP